MFKEIESDMWCFENDVKVVTTNSIVKSNGRAVMGAGLALQASKRFELLSTKLADNIRKHGNHCFYFPEYKIITFPTKYNWRDKSDIDLILQSMEELENVCAKNRIEKIIMSHVGCGNGRLLWEDVKKKLVPFFEKDIIEYVVVKPQGRRVM